MRYTDIYMVDFSPVIGSEQGMYRPAAIISNDLFNQGTKMRVVVPISSSSKYASDEKWRDYPLIQAIPENQVVSGFALCNQYKTIDLKARKGKKLGNLPKNFVDELALIIRSTIG